MLCVVCGCAVGRRGRNVVHDVVNVVLVVVFVVICCCCDVVVYGELCVVVVGRLAGCPCSCYCLGVVMCWCCWLG